ncbi:MAG: hypothetical protein QMC67_05115 [Candidatus Wallbacteria bacterium]
MNKKIHFEKKFENSELSEELKKYTANAFISAQSIFEKLPLADEEFTGTWREYLTESKKIGVFETLKKKLPQLNFPIEKNISLNDEYRRAVTAKAPPESFAVNSGLVLNSAEELTLTIHETSAGSIPVIIVKNREDFVNLCRALAFKNEPVEIQDSMGGLAISGYNNCGRYIEYLKNKTFNDFFTNATDTQEKQKSFYQDCFLLLSDGPYSGLPAFETSFSENEWREISLKIRLGHESAHYFTKRCLGSMRNNAHDELIADYAGICNALGEYDASLFLKCCGIENYPEIRINGRIHNYKGSPSLNQADFNVMCGLLYNASTNIETFDRKNRKKFSRGDFTAAAILCIASLSLVELAVESGADALQKKLEKI